MNKRETELEKARADGWRRLHDGTPHTPLCSSCADLEQARQRVAELTVRFEGYDGGDRPMSPPVALIRELYARSPATG